LASIDPMEAAKDLWRGVLAEGLANILWRKDTSCKSYGITGAKKQDLRWLWSEEREIGSFIWICDFLSLPWRQGRRAIKYLLGLDERDRQRKEQIIEQLKRTFYLED
jgi:hypothetical protein